MRLLFVTAHRYIPQSYGGMESSTNELCAILKQRGHHVAVLAGFATGAPLGFASRLKMHVNERLSGCKVARDFVSDYAVWRTWHSWDAVEYVAQKERPDLIVVMAGQPVRMAMAAKRTQTPVLMRLHDVEFHQHGGKFEDLGNIPCVANSRFTSERYRNAFGVNPGVIYPCFSAEKYRSKTTRENVTFINPHPYKGRDIALSLARLCPEIPFVFVESWRLSDQHRQQLNENLATLPNATLMRPQRDMRKVYERCKILLAPSMWEEAYGRVVTEAQLSGIPAIASTRGGLPEAVGTGGILLDPAQPITDWAAIIRKLWRDESEYAELSNAASTYAERPELSPAFQGDAWEEAMRECLSRRTLKTRAVSVAQRSNDGGRVSG